MRNRGHVVELFCTQIDASGGSIETEVNELAAQGVKPWDDDAHAVLVKLLAVEVSTCKAEASVAAGSATANGMCSV